MIYVGIDVAKSKHDCCVLGSDGEILASFIITNNKTGFEELVSTITRFSSKNDLSDVKIGLESTGHYSVNIANYLLQKRLSVRIFNPLQVNLARKAASLRKTKTDKSDSKFLASMLFSDGSKPYSPPSLPISELKILTRNRKRLISYRSRLRVSLSRLVTILFPELPAVVWSVNQKSIYAMLMAFPTASSVAEANRDVLARLLIANSKGKYGSDKADQIQALAKNSIGLDSRAAGFELQQTIRLIQNLQGEIDLLDAEIKAVMDELNPAILSIPGIGYTLGAIIISEIGNVANFSNPAKLLAFAGMEPSTYESGNYRANNTPMVKRGSPYLRWALYQAARLVAYRDETFRLYAEKKRAEGKHYFVTMSHVAKKLVRVLFFILKNNVQYDTGSMR